MTLSEYIKLLLKLTNYSTYKLAQCSDLAISTISNIISNRNSPTIYSLERISNGFGITLTEFFVLKDKLESLSDPYAYIDVLTSDNSKPSAYILISLLYHNK